MLIHSLPQKPTNRVIRFYIIVFVTGIILTALVFYWAVEMHVREAKLDKDHPHPSWAITVIPT